MREDGMGEDPKKGTQLLDVYALEIQIYTEQRNNKKLKQVGEGGRGRRGRAHNKGELWHLSARPMAGLSRDGVFKKGLGWPG